MYRNLFIASLPLLLAGCTVASGGSGGNSITSDTVEIPAGRVIVGSDDDTFYDSPMVEVSLPAFQIDVYEVTNGQYKDCVSAGACSEPGIKGFDLIPDYYENSDYGDHPVSFVTWYQAAEYCGWRGMRLPLELEWERAARGTDGRMYPWGNDAPSCDRAHWGDCNAQRAGAAGPMEVGSLPDGISPAGAHDMAGNMAEWVADWYDSETYYSFEEGELPTRARYGRNKSVRGGSWWCEDSRLPSFKREPASPFYRAGNIGFRCASSL